MKNYMERVASLAQPMLKSLDVKVNLNWTGIISINGSLTPSRQGLTQLQNLFIDKNITSLISVFVGQRSRTLDSDFKLI